MMQLADWVNTWKQDFPNLTTVAGHRDFKNTACPGDYVYFALPAFRTALQEDTMADPMPDWAEPIFEKARTAGVFTQHTDPNGTVEAWELAVFLDRAGLLDSAVPAHNHPV